MRRLGRQHLLALPAVAVATWCAGAAVGSSGLDRPTAIPHGPALRAPAAARVVDGRAARLTRRLRALAGSSHGGRPTRSLRKHLVGLSRRREHALAALLARDPAAGSSLVLPRSARHVLRALPGAAVETPVKLSGTYRVWHRDGAADPFRDQLVSGNGRHVVTLRGDLPRLQPGDRIDVAGYRLGRNVLVQENGVRPKRRAGRRLAALASPNTVGEVKTAVLVATFADSAGPPDMEAIRTNFQGNGGHDAVSYFSEVSYGKMSLSPSFYGPYTLSTTSSTGCSGNVNQSLIAAAAADVTFNQFSRLVFVYNCPGTSFGSATSVGPVSTPQGTVTAAQIALDARSAASLYPVVHELSHTLGAFQRHAAFYVCLPETFVAPSRFDAGCTSSEYGDAFDVLGGGATRAVSQLDPHHKAGAGWFDSGQYPTVGAAGTHTYALAPYEQATSGVLALNIPRGQSGTAFTVEYRQPLGVDAWMGSPAACAGCTVTNGASIRLVAADTGSGGGSDTQLLDTTPGTIASSSYYPIEDGLDGALVPGRTFTDPEYGISITAVSAGSSGLTVQVTVPEQTCVRGAPTVSAPSPLMQSGSIGTASTYTVTLRNTDTAGCAANTFRYTPPSDAAVKIAASPDFLTLAPGASATISLAVSPSALTTAGSYGFSSADGIGAGTFRSNSLGTSTAIVSGLTYQLVSALDATAPAAPGGLSARALGSRAVSVSWTPASDNVGVVGYRITRGGAVYTVATSSFVDGSVGPGSTYSYSVQAFDRKGNLSPAASVSVTTPLETDSTAPKPPTVTASASDHALSVSWTAASDDTGVAYYRVYPCLVPRCIVPAGVRSFTVEGLPTRTKYELQVLAVDGDGNSSDLWSGRYTVYTAAAGTTAPSQPKHLISPSGSYSRVALTWEPSTDDGGVAGYDVYRNNRKIARVPSSSYTDTLVGGPSEYYVQAVDAAGSLSAPSARVWFPAPVRSSSDSSAPTANVSEPLAGASLSGTVPVTATATDDVAVSTVELYLDGALKASRTAAPYSFSLDTTGLVDGAHWLYVRAYDAAGNYGTGGLTDVNVSNRAPDTTPPSISIVAPLDAAAVSGAVSVSAAATDDVDVARVEFSVDSTAAATSAGAPYGFTWNASSATLGTHIIAARAYDAAGNSAVATVDVTVVPPPDTTPPTVSITAPADGATVAGTVQVEANTADDVGVTKVELSVDGAAAASLTLDTTKLANGSHTLAVKAFDAADNSSTAHVWVNVQNAPPDTLAPKAPSGLKAPVAGTTQIALYWTPTTDNVAVTAYEVYRDGVKVAETALPTYVDSGLPPATGHTYQVRARDAAGNRSAASSTLAVKTIALSTSSTGTVAGVVYNAQGRPVSNVVVVLAGGAISKSTKTNASGVYKFSSLPPGSYTVTWNLASTTNLASTLAADDVPSSSATVVAGQTTLIVPA